jgi:hypothetical protein
VLSEALAAQQQQAGGSSSTTTAEDGSSSSSSSSMSVKVLNGDTLKAKQGITGMRYWHQVRKLLCITST